MILRPLLIAACLAASSNLAAAQGWPSPAQQQWQRVAIPQSDAGVDIPAAIFSNDGGRVEGGAGRRFLMADGRANLTVQSFRNDRDDSPAAFLARKKPPAGIIYTRVTPRFFVVSSIRGGNIWYNRCNRAPQAMNCVIINYPVSEKRRWDAVVTRISHTLS
jgi:hypothetical protein